MCSTEVTESIIAVSCCHLIVESSKFLARNEKVNDKFNEKREEKEGTLFDYSPQMIHSLLYGYCFVFIDFKSGNKIVGICVV